VETYDVVIVGAGVIGLSTAYHIKRKNPKSNVLVVEKAAGPGFGNTAKSWACFRTFFTSSTNRALAGTSIDFFEHVEKDLKIDLQMDFHGYFFLFNEDHFKEMETNLKILEKQGVEFLIHDGKELETKLGMVLKPRSEQASILGLVDIDLGMMVTKAGSLDSDSIVRFYESEFSKLGGKIQYSTLVRRLLLEARKTLDIPNEPLYWQEQRVSGVDTDKGIIKAKKTIVATGAWANELLDPIGVDSFTKSEKKHEFVVGAESSELKELLKTPGFNPVNYMPYLIINCMPQVDSALHILPRPREGAYWLGATSTAFREYKMEEEPVADKTKYESGMNWVLHEYLPQFKNAKLTNSWGAQYALNSFDGQPIVYEKDDLIVVGAASGSGLMKADAIGRLAASLYSGEDEAELYGGTFMKVSDLGIKKRKIDYETVVL
jgi:glycine/D-amino acid oxidase-like deaminating enzyme